jgi:hypothetical protein
MSDTKPNSKNKKPKRTISPQPGSPMDKFNDAMRKILSAPKKDSKQKQLEQGAEKHVESID